MSTIDPNAESKARLWMNYTTVKEERDNWKESAEKAEQEIARLNDQLATARNLISLAEAVCNNYSEAGTAARLRAFLDNKAAIPTSDREVHACGDPDCIVPHPPASKLRPKLPSDRERLLEEARLLVSTLSMSGAHPISILDRADVWLAECNAKLGASNQ